MVSKQRVMRHKLNTDVNLIFLVKCPGSYNHLQGTKISLFTHVTSTLTLLSVMKSSLLVVVLGGFCTCSFLRGNVSVLLMFFPAGCGSRCKQASRLPSL